MEHTSTNKGPQQLRYYPGAYVTAPRKRMFLERYKYLERYTLRNNQQQHNYKNR